MLVILQGPNIHGNNINGNNISGGTITGTTINGTNINGGTIKGARLEGVTGKFSGTLEVNHLVGGNLCEVFIARVYKTISFYQSLINISAAPVKRIFFIVNSHKTFTVEANQSLRYLYTHHDENPPPEFSILAVEPQNLHRCIRSIKHYNNDTALGAKYDNI